MNVTLLFGYRRFSGDAVHSVRRPRPRPGDKCNTVQKAAGTLYVPYADSQKLGFIRIVTQVMYVGQCFV